MSNENAKLSNSTYITLDTNKLIVKDDELEPNELNKVESKKNRRKKLFLDNSETRKKIVCCFCDDFQKRSFQRAKRKISEILTNR